MLLANMPHTPLHLPVLQRRHYIMALKRSAYLKRGANYTPAATLLRCVRPDQSSATVRCHYLTDGGVNFAFTMRRAEYFIPVGILLKCFVEVRGGCLQETAVACRKPVLLAGTRVSTATKHGEM
jgi:DNA-directed RNA polymerase I subunit RPA2